MNFLKRQSLLQYSLLAMPLAFAGLPIYIHAPDFYAVQFNISLTLIGLVLLGLRLIDAVQDPIIGYLSDKYGRYRRHIIILGLTLLSAGFIGLFNPINQLSNPLLVLSWMALSIFLCTTGFSIVTINMQAQGSSWRVQPSEISRIMSWREAMGLIGLLIGSIMPSILLINYSSDKAYSILSIIFLPLLIISGTVFLKWIKNTAFDQPDIKQAFFFREFFKDKYIRNIYLIFLVSGIASAIPATLVLFFIRDYLQLEAYTGLFLLLYFLSGVLAMPLWQYLAKTRSSIIGWLISMLLACFVFIGAFFLDAGDIIAFGIICILSGIAIGGDLALPPAIIAEYIKKKSRQKFANQYYAVSAFISKSALAIATGIVLPLLGLYGYQPGQMTQDIGLPLSYALIPCFIKLLAAFLLWSFILTHHTK